MGATRPSLAGRRVRELVVYAAWLVQKASFINVCWIQPDMVDLLPFMIVAKHPNQSTRIMSMKRAPVVMSRMNLARKIGSLAMHFNRLSVLIGSN